MPDRSTRCTRFLNMILTIVIVFAVVVGMLMWLVFVPIRLKVDTESMTCEVSQLGTIRLTWNSENYPRPQVRVLGLNVAFRERSEEQEVNGRKKVSVRRAKSLNAWLYLIKGCAKSVRLNRLMIKLDTDDVVLNAKLIPAAVFLSSDCASFTVNFCGTNSLKLDIEARLNKLIWTFLVFLTIK